VGPRIVGLAAVLARKYGPWAVARLARAGQAWLADPSNQARRDDLVAQLRTWAARASGTAAQTAARLADDLGTARRVSTAAWERDVIARRMDIETATSAPAREAALVAYAEEAEAAAAILSEAPRERKLAEITETFAAERGMLLSSAIAADVRDRALRALQRAEAACRRAAESSP
jgi:hypothetical protein